MTAIVRKMRCAIYTRKSTEEGLDMDYNSLDAQRDACHAYIASQKSEGWVALRDAYDDGGFSGGTLNRPSVQRLLEDVREGLVDVIVVYKIDRLSRSLADFSKLVELFDQHKVTFVSVTQSFNTTTSMGRLTLNILLSFAQFERELGGERVRDKIAASRAKGIWMGGFPPLGYDVVALAGKLPADLQQSECAEQGRCSWHLAALDPVGTQALFACHGDPLRWS
jgi:DNA invertase Pin-like site-specific DNA recombinase